MQEQTLYEFGRFRLDPEQRVLLREEMPVPLPPKAINTLKALLENRGRLVLKEDLLAEVWPDVFVEENNLAQYISLLRKTIGDDRHAPNYIQTVARRGYRFCRGTALQL